MFGLAKDLFKQGAVSIDDFSFSVKTDKPWPTVEALLHAGYFSFVDYSFAKAVLSQSSETSEDIACFLCAMMAFSRMGHLCMSVVEGEIYPSLDELMPPQFVGALDLTRAKAMVVDGAQALPREVASTNGAVEELKPIVAHGSSFYLQKYFALESKLLEKIEPFLKETRSNDSLIESDPDITASLNKAQAHSVTLGLNNRLTLLTGGPGTGKSHTAVHLIANFLKHYPNKRVVVAAPTGKAAAHLAAKIALSPLLKDQKIEVGTLHSLLGIKRREDLTTHEKYLQADLIIVDEASMIDLSLFTAFIGSLCDDAHCFMMGDDQQLPPVESGTIFAELCHYARERRPELLATLKECHRTEQKEILEFSDDIRKGNLANIEIALKAESCSALHYHPLNEPSKTTLMQEVKNGFPMPSSKEPEPEVLMRTLDHLRVLTPLRKGPYGVDALNSEIWESILKTLKQNQYWSIPIMITKTSYHLDLCNGEMGYLVRFIGNKTRDVHTMSRQDYALFPDKSGKGWRRIAASILPAFEHAYALTVHKSQGSEFDCVLFYVPPGSEHFGREILYTGVTRARKNLILFSEDEVIARCIEKKSGKRSGFYNRITAL
ncbi:MAG: exodeoxyribonuclease V subunit alpha [Simkaniaceae bacterium]|nr:exodeoxyribonuclease V subunit alpha [Simkaniaceae bacterium]